MDGPAWDQKELSVGELSARSGVAVSALHFYERQKLISSRRTTGNQRRYRRDTLRRVALIRVAQRVGIPLADIGAALSGLPDGRTPNRQDWIRLSKRWRTELDERIHHLMQLRDEFTDCIGCGCLSLDRCVLANPYDQLAAQGAGPRRLVDEEPHDAGSTAPVRNGAREGDGAHDTAACEGPDDAASCTDTT